MVSKSTILVVMQICSHLIRNAHWRVNSTDSVSSATRVLNQHWCLQLIPSQFKHNPSACRASRYDPHRHTHTYLTDSTVDVDHSGSPTHTSKYATLRSPSRLRRLNYSKQPVDCNPTLRIPSFSTTDNRPHSRPVPLSAPPTRSFRLPPSRWLRCPRSDRPSPPTYHGTSRRHAVVKNLQHSPGVQYTRNFVGTIGTMPPNDVGTSSSDSRLE